MTRPQQVVQHKGTKLAQDANDNKRTIEMFDNDEKQLLAEALQTHAEKVGRKAAATAPKSIKELWQAELKKIEDLARKVLK